MGCNCNNRCNGMLAVMQTGDTVPVQIVLKDGPTAVQLEEGSHILIGFYDAKRNLLLRVGTDDGRVTYSDGVYTVLVSHEESLRMKGKVSVELTVASDNGTVVYHGDRIPVVGFDGRMNNMFFEGDGPVPIPDDDMTISHDDIDRIMED